MQQAKEKWATARRFMVFILVSFFATAWALGQAGAPVRFDVPYAFTVGSRSCLRGLIHSQFHRTFQGSQWNRPPGRPGWASSL